ncbi:LSU ribosomal protein L13P [Magnetococcus marinus MC-1]|uniref:Large ribosomal subunit protein uL13 n=1 Tax=Magnetococcus marinus (strain ATCC BAA-1437 / JCM 17883 / MC-1) TaxID=156889 RepID=RL13_MAGMM|nr:50S ribosomal protein L13 [Magnetococcus marinus]A0L480.1 RecName: Full=Large ribosomal subunit protein uL13; AltName: Full=50S ribosomal protein L13 [Magnetococcus marinus MC-1]ABK42773.1 LSU ribosomal protein L13P [Magnetococcus marinus MC-1]
MKSFVAKPSTIERKWYVIDATDMVVGRLASEVAKRLRGKHKPTYTPFMDCGDNIIIVNAEKVRFTGNKRNDKVYYWHSRFPGGLKSITADKELSGNHPERVLEKAIKGMLPKNVLGRQMFRKLNVYKGSEHPHTAQQPEELKLG